MATSIPVLRDVPDPIATEKTVALTAPEIVADRDDIARIFDTLDIALALHRQHVALRGHGVHVDSACVTLMVGDIKHAEYGAMLWASANGITAEPHVSRYASGHQIRTISLTVDGARFAAVQYPMERIDDVPAEAKRCGVDEEQMWDRSEP